MSLDLTKVAAQVVGMVARLKAGGEERRRHLQQALETASDESIDFSSLKRKIAGSKTTWLVAGLVEGFCQHYEVKPVPAEFSVIATDGSHIDVDRHRPERCCLINISSVVLHYGNSPAAFLGSSPCLYAGDEGVIIAPAGAGGREQLLEGALLGVKRSVEECQRLMELAVGLAPGSKTLALLDGTLILWGLEAGYPEFVTEVLLDNGFLNCLGEMRKLNSDRRLALASYISFPRGTDVVNALRVALCPHDPPDCDRFCPERVRDCDAVAGVRDRELFSSLLGPGERSALFISQSSVVRKHYGEHQVYFFYLKADDEIARVEIPQWVARDEGLLDLTHSLVLDQCRRGQGYPVALSEAHEQAVVTTADRENFWVLVESSLLDEKLPTLTSAKSFSKRTRWV